MADESIGRRLAAILSADVVGYSRLMGADEAGTLAALQAHRRELIDPEIEKHDGRLVKLMGDGALVEFASIVQATESRSPSSAPWPCATRRFRRTGASTFASASISATSSSPATTSTATASMSRRGWRAWDLSDPSGTPVVLKNGQGPTTSLAVDAIGKLLASSSSSNGISIWQIREPERPPLVFSTGTVYKMAISPDGRYLASGGNTSSLRLWDLEPTGTRWR